MSTDEMSERVRLVYQFYKQLYPIARQQGALRSEVLDWQRDFNRVLYTPNTRLKPGFLSKYLRTAGWWKALHEELRYLLIGLRSGMLEFRSNAFDLRNIFTLVRMRYNGSYYRELSRFHPEPRKGSVKVWRRSVDLVKTDFGRNRDNFS